MSGSSDIVAAADALDAKMNQDSGAIVRSLTKGLDHQKTVSRWLVVSLCLDIMLTAVLAVYVNKVNEQTVQIAKNANSQVVNNQQVHNTCLIGNDFRINEHGLWNQILSLPPSPGLTPLQLKARLESNDKIRYYIETTFKLRICK